MQYEALPVAADCGESRSGSRGERWTHSAPPPSLDAPYGSSQSPQELGFSDPGLDGLPGSAGASQAPDAGQSPPPDPGYLDTTPNHENPPDSGTCGGRWLVRRCGCQARLVWAYGCGRRGCPRCGLQKCQASADRLFDRLYGGEATHLQVIVLTVPPSERPALEGPAGGARWAVALREFVRVLRESHGFTWCYLRSHPRGDESPDFAPHANIVGVQVKGSGRLDVDALRAAWCTALGIPGPVDIHVQFFNLTDYAGVTSLKHWCNYVERSFPGWTWSGQWARWYGEHVPLKTKRTEDADKGKCPDCGEYHSYEEPQEADWLAVGAIETFIESKDPVPPAVYARWRKLEPRKKEMVAAAPVCCKQGDLFGPDAGGFRPKVGG